MKRFGICMMVCLACGIFSLEAQDAQERYEVFKKQQQDKYANTKQQNEEKYHSWQRQKQEEYARWKLQRDNANGQPATQQEAPPAQTTPVDPESGTQPIALVQTQPVQTLPVPPDMKVWVVIVGVAEYMLIQNRLNYTDDDAYKMYAFYKSPEGGSLSDKQITLLIDEEATRANVVNAIKTVYSRAGKNDMIIFYFAGHGTEGAFITHEFAGEVDENFTGLLLHEELNEVFTHSQARYKYIIADACHSGSSVNQYKNRGIKARGTFYQAFEKAEGSFVMLLSSMGDEYSLETSDIRQGVFSYYLLRGLKGECDKDHNRVVSVIELFDFVESSVKTCTKGMQNPVISGNYDDALPIAVVNE
jgi:hypothetical protein